MDAPETFPRYRVEAQTAHRSRVLWTLRPGGQEAAAFSGDHAAALRYAGNLRDHGFVAWSGEPAEAPEAPAEPTAADTIAAARDAYEKADSHVRNAVKQSDDAIAVVERMGDERKAAERAFAEAVFAAADPRETEAVATSPGGKTAYRLTRETDYHCGRATCPAKTVSYRVAKLALFALALLAGCGPTVTTHRTASPGNAAAADVADPSTDRMPPVPMLAR